MTPRNDVQGVEHSAAEHPVKRPIAISAELPLSCGGALELHNNAIVNPTFKQISLDLQRAHEYEDVLGLIGFGKTHWILLLTAGLLLMMVINESMGMAIITIASQCDFETNSMDKALMSAACFIGIFISSYFWGYLSDTIGRRSILLYATLAGNCVSFISVFVPNFWVFVVLRLLVGLAIAGAASTVYAYLGEFFSLRHRPVAINYASMFVGLSQIYTPCVAWLVLSMDWSLMITDSFAFRPWRLLIIFNLLPGLIAISILFFLPESPRFLLSLGKDSEALAATNFVCLHNTGKSLEELRIFKLKSEYSKDQENLLTTTKSAWTIVRKMWQETCPLFRPPHLRNFLIACIVMFGLFFSSSGMGLWFPDIQNRMGANTGEDLLTVCQVIDASIAQMAHNVTEIVCDDSIKTKSLIDSITFGASFTVGFVIMGLIINPLGRKRLVIGALAFSGVCGLTLLWLLDPTVIVVSFCLFLVLPGLCISVLSGAVVDLVPTHLRGKAVCICLMLGRSGSIIGSNVIGIVLNTQCIFTFSFFSGFMFVCAALTFILPI